MISQGFSGFEIKLSMAIRANTVDVPMQLEKGGDCGVGGRRSYSPCSKEVGLSPVFLFER